LSNHTFFSWYKTKTTISYTSPCYKSIRHIIFRIYRIFGWSNYKIKLPTEAEWEYAARGGSNDPDYLYSGSDDIHSVAWINCGTTSYVGTKLPNQLGLYDMSGNVWEWCWDWLGDYPSESQMNPVGPTSGSRRVLRGGGWNWSATNCRVLKRYSSYPNGSTKDVGFRLVRNVE
jgi:formylglycine-generating enzyme required for sulfatase activity